MAQSVTNDALWEKLSEIDKKIERLSETQKSSASMSEQVGLKDEIVASIKEDIQTLNLSNKSHFEENKKNVVIVNKNILLGLKQITDIQKRINTCIELGAQRSNEASFFDFKLLKVKKTSIVITMLGILIFTLTIFCIKQQDKYALLTEACHKQRVTIQELHEELETCKEKQPNKQRKK